MNASAGGPDLVDRVGVALATKARNRGGESCQGNPPTPYTIELGEARGDRPIVDVGVYPNRPVELPAR